jgi:hypothetical protein
MKPLLLRLNEVIDALRKSGSCMHAKVVKEVLVSK